MGEIFIKRLFAFFLALLILLSAVSLAGCRKNSDQNLSSFSSDLTGKDETATATDISSVISSAADVSSETPAASSSSSAGSGSDKNNSSKKTSKPVSSSKPSVPAVSGDYSYNTNMDINDNVFLDSLVYTGYNIEKHRADGLMWKYILAKYKRGYGWLSPLGYGNASGYETTSAGKPDINAMAKKGGLVCASYVSYVYFNYLPNVAGIDTSFLTKPKRSYSANDWYLAAKDWVKRGYSEYIPFTATKGQYINFKPAKEIPIGSILVFCNGTSKTSDFGSHVCIYAGYEETSKYHWVYHVGNDNGPEFCAVERMICGPDPQWPIAVITPPRNLRFAAGIEITLTDTDGQAISGVEFKAKNQKTGTVYKLGETSESGKLSKEGLPFGNYTLTQTVPKGYTVPSASRNISLTVKNNGLTIVKIENERTVSESSAEQTASLNSTSSVSSVDSAGSDSSAAPESEISSIPDSSEPKAGSTGASSDTSATPSRNN